MLFDVANKSKKDHTVNGQCSGCGDCCQNILVLSDSEIFKIKKYIKKNDIKPINRNSIVFQNYNNTCPFLNEDKRCNIYEVRPEICSRFSCSEYLTIGKPFQYNNKRVVNMLKEFAPDAFQPNPPDIDYLNEKYQQNLNKLISSKK